MIKYKKHISGVIAMSFLAAMLSGCQKPAGPAEQAGKQIDNAAEAGGVKIKQAGEAIQDAAKGKK